MAGFIQLEMMEEHIRYGEEEIWGGGRGAQKRKMGHALHHALQLWYFFTSMGYDYKLWYLFTSMHVPLLLQPWKG